MSVSIRKAKDTDIHELVPLAARTFPLACPPEMDRTAIENFIYNELNEKVFAEWLGNDDANVVVATDGAMLVGYTVCVNNVLPKNAELDRQLPLDTTVMMTKFYVHPEFHAAGVSRNMMAYLLDQYSTTDRQWMWLGTNVANARAIRFYERSGFEQIGTRSFDVGGSMAEDIVLARRLPTLDCSV